MDLLVMVIAFNIFAVLVMTLSGSNKNIESRTEREEDILKKDTE
jgi:hypothetical protein